MRTQLVIFDLDGTLIDSAPEIADAVNEVLRTERLPECPLAEIRALIGEGARTTVARAYAQSQRRARGETGAAAGTDPDPDPGCAVLPDRTLLDRLMSTYAQSILASSGRRSTIYPHVHTALDYLRNTGVQTALVTNKEERFALPLLTALGLRGFAPIVCGDTLPTRKPHPAPILRCLAHHDVAPEHALVIGDSELDVIAARAAGVRSLLVAWGYGSLERSDPASRLNSFAELPREIESARSIDTSVPTHWSPIWAD